MADAMQQNTVKSLKGMFKGANAGAVAVGFVGDALNVGQAFSTFKRSTEEGDNIAVAGTKAAIDFGVSEMFYGAMARTGGMAGMLKGTAISMAVTTGAQLGFQHMTNTGQKLGQGSESVKGLGSGHFDLTSPGYTMRQRSLNVIRSNGANINSAFGNEARNYWLGL